MGRDGAPDRIVDGHAVHGLAAAPRGHAGDDARAVLETPLAVEARLGAGEALHDHARVAVDQDAHARASAVRRTMSCAASFSVVPRGT